MDLFNKDKELVLKIMNGILILWILISACIVIGNTVNLVFKDYYLTYEDYKLINCSTDRCDKENIDCNIEILETECKKSFNREQVQKKQDKISNYKALTISLFSLALGTGTLIVLNRKSK